MKAVDAFDDPSTFIVLAARNPVKGPIPSSHVLEWVFLYIAGNIFYWLSVANLQVKASGQYRVEWSSWVKLFNKLPNESY